MQALPVSSVDTRTHRCNPSNTGADAASQGPAFFLWRKKPRTVLKPSAGEDASSPETRCEHGPTNRELDVAFGGWLAAPASCGSAFVEDLRPGPALELVPDFFLATGSGLRVAWLLIALMLAAWRSS